MMRRWVVSAAATVVIVFLAGPVSAAMAQKDVPTPKESRACVDCHAARKEEKGRGTVPFFLQDHRRWHFSLVR